MITTNVVSQLVDIYYREETWHSFKMIPEEAVKYHMKLLDNGNIVYYEENGELVGYVEFWKITPEQFGRLVLHMPFSAYLENVTTGNVAYVANVWIRDDKRRSHVTKFLILEFFKHCSDCDYYVGEALRKKTQPVKVFKKADLKSRLFTRGIYGER